MLMIIIIIILYMCNAMRFLPELPQEYIIEREQGGVSNFISSYANALFTLSFLFGCIYSALSSIPKACRPCNITVT